jgi:hypothetical protein
MGIWADEEEEEEEEDDDEQLVGPEPVFLSPDTLQRCRWNKCISYT